MPPLTLTNVTPSEELLAVNEDAPTRAELQAEIGIVAGLALAVVALAVNDPGGRAIDPWLVLLSIGLLVLSQSARFDLRMAWTAPVQLALVPILFLLPPWLVPTCMAVAIVLARLPEVVRGNVAAARLLLAPGNAWFTVGPAAVLAAAGSPSPDEASVLLLLAALLAQFTTDFLASALWNLRTRGLAPLVQLKEDYLIYAIDGALAPVGLLAALSIDESPYYLVLLVPLFGVLAVFAGERRVRLEQLTELNGAYQGTALLLAEVVDADDAYTGRHTRDVVELSVAVADAMGLDDRRRRNVEFGALLHDVGKVVIPKEIINKPGPLDDDEWELMRTHTVAGQRMLDQVGGAMRDVGAIVRATHERWDGGGYPDGLAGSDIPLEARIICACDAYNAMTTTRSYRPAMGAADAVTELRRCAGTQFDASVVSALIALVGVPAHAAEPVAA